MDNDMLPDGMLRCRCRILAGELPSAGTAHDGTRTPHLNPEAGVAADIPFLSEGGGGSS